MGTASEAIPDSGDGVEKATPILPSHGVDGDVVGGLEPAQLGLHPGAQPGRVVPRWRQGCPSYLKLCARVFGVSIIERRCIVKL